MTPAPPRIAERLLGFVIRRPEIRDGVVGDLAEEFAACVRRQGLAAGRRWYWRQALVLCVHLGVAAPSPPRVGRVFPDIPCDRGRLQSDGVSGEPADARTERTRGVGRHARAHHTAHARSGGGNCGLGRRRRTDTGRDIQPDARDLALRPRVSELLARDCHCAWPRGRRCCRELPASPARCVGRSARGAAGAIGRAAAGEVRRTTA